MSPAVRPESVGSRRGRRIAVFLAILLLVGLPLYLWPLRGGIQGLPGAAALSGPPPDPRSAQAVAQLPADVWDALLGRRGSPAPSSGGPEVPDNLTRIAPHEERDANGSLDFGSGGVFFPRFDAGSAPPTSAMLADGGAGSGGDSSGASSGDAASSSGFTSGPSPSGGGGFFPFPGGLGPFGGAGGEGVAPPTFVVDPDPNDPPMPTPEPGTLLLVGLNLALLGAFAWRRPNRDRERKPSG